LIDVAEAERESELVVVRHARAVNATSVTTLTAINDAKASLTERRRKEVDESS
jgi:hypothetical protein